MTSKLRQIDFLEGNEGKTIRLELNGREIRRRVYFNRFDGLFIRINNKKIFAYDFYKADEIYLDSNGLPIEEV
jgi:hypothetical protein